MKGCKHFVCVAALLRAGKGHVLAHRERNEMIRVNATTLLAFVVDVVSGRDQPPITLVKHAMCRVVYAVVSANDRVAPCGLAVEHPAGAGVPPVLHAIRLRSPTAVAVKKLHRLAFDVTLAGMRAGSQLGWLAAPALTKPVLHIKRG
jgi:hypothetical protein